ncbi:hypothetical protein SAMN04489859_10893 [Paracoccus alcaliphilus]|uniref:Uncharacterized protein n=1 Tax=Paracoccus alcaliphilus TaxID=34002 RepID=A0A1H8PBL5_9RHOB|nr:hypothetical protein SAMN04489859_10893 [Paracoccus alcaliphilus]
MIRADRRMPPYRHSGGLGCTSAPTGFATVHNVDFYDAEDGPGVQGYEADGNGVWIIDGE